MSGGPHAKRIKTEDLAQSEESESDFEGHVLEDVLSVYDHSWKTYEGPGFRKPSWGTEKDEENPTFSSPFELKDAAVSDVVGEYRIFFFYVDEDRQGSHRPAQHRLIPGALNMSITSSRRLRAELRISGTTRKELNVIGHVCQKGFRKNQDVLVFEWKMDSDRRFQNGEIIGIKEEYADTQVSIQQVLQPRAASYMPEWSHRNGRLPSERQRTYSETVCALNRSTSDGRRLLNLHEQVSAGNSGSRPPPVLIFEKDDLVLSLRSYDGCQYQCPTFVARRRTEDLS